MYTCHVLWRESSKTYAPNEFNIIRYSTSSSRRIKDFIPAPKMRLPGHAESYNPPPEYLMTDKEKERWEEQAEVGRGRPGRRTVRRPAGVSAAARRSSGQRGQYHWDQHYHWDLALCDNWSHFHCSAACSGSSLIFAFFVRKKLSQLREKIDLMVVKWGRKSWCHL